MTQETLGGAVIHYVNGEKEKLVFLWDETTVDAQEVHVEKIRKALQSNMLLFKTTDNRMLAIPVCSILKIEINPAPIKVPENVIEKVRIVTTT
jgi:hypothetical protein